MFVYLVASAAVGAGKLLLDMRAMWKLTPCVAVPRPHYRLFNLLNQFVRKLK